MKAAANALQKLAGLAPYEYRRGYRCDCEGAKGREIDAVMESVGTAI